MMKCEEIQELLGAYWDLPANDPTRSKVDEHINHCESCAAEFEIWQESTDLIQSAAEMGEPYTNSTPISLSVMNRIYKDESWRVPVTGRMYAFSFKLRRNMTAMIAICLALFIFSFVYSINNQQNGDTVALSTDSSVIGRMSDPVVVAGGKSESMNVRTMPSAVASLKGFSEPFMYQVGPIHTYKDYLLFLSLLGLTCTLLTMNWFSRTKS
ncbi:Putative zinc-finger [Paenibacillus sp. 1_12]|uniref:anti-sigma factor family protein n=1 Tax=Paenibacillus sp. 1_12 TaxID=1566278 RepID=UPI0008EE7C80|nr:zf-HC2 domain-containing protein [Paenibacillus sp. 1_12]SFK91458.1 Putative zinc-finger [Paenibacillus sp. 1_12]